MKVKEFEKLVDEAVSMLPERFKKALDNVQVVVELWPRVDIARGRLLLGLYHGIPKTTWGRFHGQLIPDKISIYMGPIVYLGKGDPRKIKELVADTVIHEVAHHFGISDRRLNAIKRKSDG